MKLSDTVAGRPMRLFIVLIALTACEGSAKLLADTQKVTETQETMREVNAAFEMHRMRHKRLPKTVAAAFPGRATPLDGWGNPFIYDRPGPGTHKWQLTSLGADGAPDGLGVNADLRAFEP